MTQHFLWSMFGILLAAASAEAAEAIPMRLTADVGQCKAPTAPRPALLAEKGDEAREAVKSGWYSALVADFNGDGWCDFAWAVPYPVNSRMESYFLSDMLILGGAKRWHAPYKGSPRSLRELNPEEWPSFRVSLTDIAFVRAQSGGAPFVLGLRDPSDLGKTWFAAGCAQYSSVHQWDDTVDGFKRVDGARRAAVLSYYYSQVERACR